MARQYLEPGIGYLNETGTRQYLLPGYGFVNETQSTGTVAPADGSSAGSSSAIGFVQSTSAAGSSEGSSSATGSSAAKVAVAGTSSGQASAIGFTQIENPHSNVTSYLLAGFGYLNETTPRQYLLPGFGFVNETQQTGYYGMSSGTSSASGVAAVKSAQTGSSGGFASALGVASSLTPATGTATGSSSASGDAVSLINCGVHILCPVDLFNHCNMDQRANNAVGFGQAAGGSEASAVAASIASASGSSQGSSSATGQTGGSIASTSGTSTGTSSATGASSSLSITTLPAVSGGYASLMGTSRLYPGYTGPLYRLIRTNDNATLDIGQDSLGRADVSGVAAWAGSNPTYIKGHFNQVTGNYIDQANSGKRPLFRMSNVDGNHYPWTFGYTDTGSLATSQGLPSETISVDRANVGMFLVARALGAGLSMKYASLETATPASIFGINCQPNNSYTISTFGSALGTTLLAPPINRLAVLAAVSGASATKIHVNDRVTSTSANTSSVATTAYLGRNTTSTTSSAVMDTVALVVTNQAPSDADATAIKQALYSIFDVVTARNNVVLCCHHSLSFNLNNQVYNNTSWRQMRPLMTKTAEFIGVAQAGKTMSAQLLEIANLTALYEPGADRFILNMGNAVNDANNYTSGFAGGNPALIDAAALNTYTNTYKSLFDQYKALGSNVRIAIDAAWQPSLSWWGGTTQDKNDKAAALTAFNSLLDANAASHGFVVNEEDTVNTVGSFCDLVHFNETGEGRRAVIKAPHIDALCV